MNKKTATIQSCHSNLAALIGVGLLFAMSAARAAEEPLNDSLIADAVERELFLDDNVSLNYIDLSVQDGIVTLEGKTYHLLGKERAARIAETIRGVRSVVNLLAVKPLTEVSGKQLAKDVKSALIADPATESYQLEVAANDDGEVTLSGTVDSHSERILSLKVAKSVRGVTDIKDKIAVHYGQERADDEILEDIQGMLRWNTLIDDGLINVGVQQGEVALRGTVGSAAEKRRARYLAWETAGVLAVDDSALEVAPWANEDDLRQKKFVPRDDEEIREALLDALRADPRVLTFKIDLKVILGKVTLRGIVANLEAKRSAERVARHTVGVRRVENFIRVRPEEELTDLEIRTNVKWRFTLDPMIEPHAIRVKVRAGVVYLEGRVDSPLQKLQAESVASRTRGVSAVLNRLIVSSAEDDGPFSNPYLPNDRWSDFPDPGPVLPGPAEHDAEIKENIKSHFYWSPFLEDDEINIVVTNGVATLKGKVDSFNERLAATNKAVQGGAVSVNNKLRVK